MHEKTNFYCLMMQRYVKCITLQNLFSEQPFLFNEKRRNRYNRMRRKIYNEIRCLH